MKQLIFLLAVVLACSPALALDVQTPSGIVSFNLPAGFAPMSDAGIRVKYGNSSRRPIRAFAIPDGSVSIAVTWAEFKTLPLTQSQLPALEKLLKSQLTKLRAGTKWLASEVITIGGRQWVRQEMIVPAEDIETHNVMYTTDLGGHMVAVNINSTVTNFDEYKASLSSVIPTVRGEAGPNKPLQPIAPKEGASVTQ